MNYKTLQHLNNYDHILITVELSRLQPEQMVLEHVGHHSKIQRKEVMELCHLNPDQAYRLLQLLLDEKS